MPILQYLIHYRYIAKVCVDRVFLISLIHKKVIEWCCYWNSNNTERNAIHAENVSITLSVSTDGRIAESKQVLRSEQYLPPPILCTPRRSGSGDGGLHGRTSEDLLSGWSYTHTYIDYWLCSLCIVYPLRSVLTHTGSHHHSWVSVFFLTFFIIRTILVILDFFIDSSLKIYEWL